MNISGRSRFLFVQVAILMLTAMIYWQSDRAWPAVLAAYLVMQAGNLAGMLWGERLRRRMRERMEALPLSRR
jgi:uncharacterized membrane protein YfcA